MDDFALEGISEFQIKQTVQALACNRTRVATIQFGAGLGGLLRFKKPSGNGSDQWHHLSHENWRTNAYARGRLTEINRLAADRFALLLSEMKRFKEADGSTLLDNSVVLWVNEMGKGNNHEYADVPIVMAGRLGGALKKGGRHLHYGERHHNDLLITLCHAFGHQEVSSFGKEALCSGPLDELLV